MLFHLVIFRGAASAAERQRAQAIVEAHGQTSLAHVALLTVVALVRADSGERLQDYCGAQFFSTPLTNALKQISRIAPLLLSVGLFALSLWAMTTELHKYQPQDILGSTAAIPPPVLLLASLLTLLNTYPLIRSIPWGLPFWPLSWSTSRSAVSAAAPSKSGTGYCPICPSSFPWPRLP